MTDAHKIARCVRGCTTDAQYQELTANIDAALSAATKRAEDAEAAWDAGREWMRRAWYELNTIRARDGAPEGVAHEWWSELTDALAEMLGDDTVPWMTKAAKLLTAAAEHRAATAEAENKRLREVLAEANNKWRHDFSAAVEQAADRLFARLSWQHTVKQNPAMAEKVK